MIRKAGGIGIAIESNCAIEFVDGRFYRVIRSNNYARAYWLYKNGAEVVTRQIRPGEAVCAPRLTHSKDRSA